MICNLLLFELIFIRKEADSHFPTRLGWFIAIYDPLMKSLVVKRIWPTFENWPTPEEYMDTGKNPPQIWFRASARDVLRGNARDGLGAVHDMVQGAVHEIVPGAVHKMF